MNTHLIPPLMDILWPFKIAFWKKTKITFCRIKSNRLLMMVHLYCHPANGTRWTASLRWGFFRPWISHFSLLPHISLASSEAVQFSILKPDKHGAALDNKSHTFEIVWKKSRAEITLGKAWSKEKEGKHHRYRETIMASRDKSPANPHH